MRIKKPHCLIHIINTVSLYGQKPVLHGRVYGHPRFQDGDRIYSSRIIRRVKGKVVTRNTIYHPISDALYQV